MEYHQITLNEYLSMKEQIAVRLKSAADDMFQIGYMLRVIQEKESFRQDGYGSITEFAKAEYGLSATTTSHFISINKKFCIENQPDKMQERYLNMGVSKLQEMLYLTDEQLENVTEDMTVRQIRALRQLPKSETALETARRDLDSAKAKLATYQNEMSNWRERAISGVYGCPSNNSVCIRTQWGSSDKEQSEGLVQCRKCWENYIRTNVIAISECENRIDELECKISELEKASDQTEYTPQNNTFSTSKMPETARAGEDFKEHEETLPEKVENQPEDVSYNTMSEHTEVKETAITDITHMAAVINSYVSLVASYVIDRNISIEEAAAQSALVTNDGNDYYITLEEDKLLFKTELVDMSFTADVGEIFSQIRKKIDDSKPVIVEAHISEAKEIKKPEETQGIRKCITGKNPYGTCVCCGADGVKCCAECNNDCNGRCGWLGDTDKKEKEAAVLLEVEMATCEYVKIAKEELEKNKEYLKQAIEAECPDRMIKKHRILVTALAGYICDLDNGLSYQEFLPGECKQPLLPRFKNDEQRKDWLKDYKAWGMWYEDLNIKHRYYKYDFPDGTRIVVTECMSWEKDPKKPWVELKTKPPIYGNPLYRMYNPAGKEIQKGVHMQEHHVHSGTNTSIMVTFLKNLQKEDNNGKAQ